MKKQSQFNPKQTQFNPISKPNKPNLSKGQKMLEFTLDVSSLALEFILGCAYLFFCRGAGAFAWKMNFTIVLIMLIKTFTTLKGANFKSKMLADLVELPEAIGRMVKVYLRKAILER